MVAWSIHYHCGWLLEVKCKKEEECVDSVSWNLKSESALSGSHTGKSVLTP